MAAAAAAPAAREAEASRDGAERAAAGRAAWAEARAWGVACCCCSWTSTPARNCAGRVPNADNFLFSYRRGCEGWARRWPCLPDGRWRCTRSTTCPTTTVRRARRRSGTHLPRHQRHTVLHLPATARRRPATARRRRPATARHRLSATWPHRCSPMHSHRTATIRAHRNHILTISTRSRHCHNLSTPLGTRLHDHRSRRRHRMHSSRRSRCSPLLRLEEVPRRRPPRRRRRRRAPHHRPPLPATSTRRRRASAAAFRRSRHPHAEGVASLR